MKKCKEKKKNKNVLLRRKQLLDIGELRIGIEE